MFIGPPPMSLSTFLPKLVAQNAVKTVLSPDIGSSGNTDVSTLFKCVTDFCAFCVAVSMSNTVSYNL